MKKRDELKRVHIVSTIWFVLCVGYILIVALHQVGVNWWVVFSLSGHGVLILLVLISMYLFAIFRGISSSQNVEAEHPVTSTPYYAAFYVTAPLLGTLAGFMAMIGGSTSGQFLLGTAMGTLGITFFVWVILDPAIGLAELLLPASRRHRAERLAEAKALREKKQKARDDLLDRVLAREEESRRAWRRLMEPQAEKLVRLLTTETADLERAEREAVGIGVSAWQTGGLSCMRELHSMAMQMCDQSSPAGKVVDYLNFWWDGIGNWRAASLA